ncbi:cytochrome P450 6k1-like isoform X1 [Ostrinia furnacalis]|uniref:unspecific monooxygenase n=2 Tax=Ostrinia furnacalis TaxID=93504 RepID=A0A7S9CEH3_OSTFU|nr:cytochrome P450 6k1-like isoform X1 [Ostrinia furnacalis]XP_028171821.1 cytochrome P450 6k1-like isoform X1 [Ostrinia furnacalis]QPF77617.1 cytochrome P450 monooxygenase CYP324A34 [Ostrinia furnacalis]
MWLYIFIVLALALAWAYTRWAKVKRFWADRGVPHLPIHPIYGSLDFLTQENPGSWMRRMYERYKGPYVGMWLFWRPALIINTPEIARRVLVKDSDNFRNRFLGTGISKGDPIGGLNLFTTNDPAWSMIRRRLTPVFTSSKLKSMNGLKLAKSKELAQRIHNDMVAKKDIEIRTMFADFTTDIIGIAAFGVDSNATLTGESSIRTITKDFMQYDFIRGLSWCSIFFFPELVNIFRFQFFPKHTTDYFRRVFRSMLAQRGGYEGKREHNDLLDALLRMKHEADLNGEVLDEDVVIAQAMIFIQGGFDTSAVSLSFLTYELAFQPEIQDKLYNELLEAKEKNGGDENMDGTILSELTYMNCIIKETLRKYPAMGYLDRIAARDYEIDEKLTIPAGTTIYVNAVGMHYDPDYFPDPMKFDPDRFLPEREHEIKPFTYMPFGEGPRNCIGMRFAQRVLWHALSSLFLKYSVRPKPNAKRPERIQLERKALFLMPEDDLYVDFIPRK